MKAILVLAVLLAAGCATQPTSTTQPVQKPAAPQITEDMLRERAKEQLATGQRLYEKGEYDSAAKSLASALDHGLLSKPEQALWKNLGWNQQMWDTKDTAAAKWPMAMGTSFVSLTPTQREAVRKLMSPNDWDHMVGTGDFQKVGGAKSGRNA